MYLIRLASDKCDLRDEYSLNEYITFLATYVTSVDNLIEVIKSLKCKLTTDNLYDFFEPLTPYIETYKPKQSTILKTSHAFCNKCELYIPSHLRVWSKNNPELFSTEIAFFHSLLTYFKTLIKADTATYPLDDLINGEDTPLSGQTNREKLKLIASVVKYYDVICEHLL